jgi:hypothetical protein
MLLRSDGAYEVKAWHPKYFDVLVGQSVEKVSMDRLKPYV